ncbi:MAG: phosphatase PAP2 family protein [Bryobacterales bacterium]|nr:phosphatase PAP2 family protein [Bryobacterales bacterium]
MALLRLIASRDHALMRRVHRWPAPKWIRLWMICATRGGDGWLWYLMAVSIFLFGGEPRYRALASSGLAAGISIAIYLWLKVTTSRRRPCHLEPHCWSTLLPPDQFSFPSGHTMSAFTMATVWSQFYPGLAPGLFFCALSIAISRILLGMHFLSDVVVGGLLGTGLAYAVVGFFL